MTGDFQASSLTRLLGRFGRLLPSAPGFTTRYGLLTLLVYVAAVVGFVAFAIQVELLLGNPLAAPRAPGVARNATDAFWHLATAFALVLPTRRRGALWLAPLLALGLDVDHVFGYYLPTVTPRSAHDLFFVMLVGILLYLIRGRPAALIAVGATVGHIAVDGGSFPFLGPLTRTLFPLPFVAQAVLVVLAALLFFLAFEPLSALRKNTNWMPLLVSCGIVVGAVYFLLPLLPALSSF